MLKLGFELEFFCRTPFENTENGEVGGQYCLVPSGLPFDECGWLVEVRSEPHTSIRKAIALLEADVAEETLRATKKGVILVREPLAEISRELKVKAARSRTKGLLRYKNIYGFETHKCSTKLATASLHISFTNQQIKTFTKERYVVDGKFIRVTEATETFNYNSFIDHAKIIVGLDKAFAAEIKAAQRNPGFYEVKSDGRIEYRSLPNDVNLEKVREVLTTLLKA